MATDSKTSVLVQSQVPGYLLEEGPNLVAFLKAYYEWMETTGQMTEQSKSLLVNQDIDTTDLDKFYSFFQREILADFPETILADRRLVAKKIKDLYRSKGTLASYNLLFRILYNQDVSIYKPSENILRASDGRWTQDTLVRLGAPFTGNLETALGKFVTGQSSGAAGKILRTVTVFESGVEVKELRLVEVTGTFLDLEQVTTSDNVGGFVVNTIGPLSDVSFGSASASGGGGHQVGDNVNLSSVTGSGAKGTISRTVNEVVLFELTSGGSGYRVGNTVVTISGGNPKGGLTGQVTVTAIANTESIFRYTDTIQGLSNTPIGYGPTYSSNSGIVSSNLAIANSSTALSVALGTNTIIVGTISAISANNGNYQGGILPGVSVVDEQVSDLDISDGAGGFKGRNAVITRSFLPGSIADIAVINGGRSYNAIDAVTVTNTTRAATNAVGDPVVSGVVLEDGSYKGTRGFLSSDQRIQDNYYYQEFSYVIKSSTALKTYRDIVRSTIHPAGTKLFGQIDIEDTLDLTSLDIESFVSIDLIGGKTGIGSISPNTVVSSDLILTRNFAIPSISPATLFGNPAVYQAGTANGFINVANNNIISSYLTKTITTFLPEPVLLGTGFVVKGEGTSFSTIVTSGSQIEINDIVPGTTGNTIYIVNTVYSNTTLTINTIFAGSAMANGTFIYAT